jgi:glycine cleavage system H protein
MTTEMRYTRDHEYIRVVEGVGTIGITTYAQEKLGDIVFVELPEIGKVLSRGQEAATVESVKAASEVYAPVGGEVTEINKAIIDNPALVNESAETDAWFLKIRLSYPRDLDNLMSADAYADYLETVD